ncbi:DinB family protein [Frankia sp. CNm7]|uniref:DinB family protein n=1 Tax=Frankia nepalensis TaxID=1836974 RepID=A0A937RSX6_9ACTN|nr:DinB family protein [Frankia nepalensis]MBL7500694.1 DinB family protein [Frankia nepalensis]MBL7515695.1 DinB family protein [Frankia nepalensis]MBL7517926.1 DinB family protein [Frankia nepalensis]MBL7632754.1 DinB family protein [Frankia nepalensis]
MTATMTLTTTTAAETGADAAVSTSEHADLLESLARHRWFLRFTVRDLTDEQARQRATVSALTLGGLIKHVTNVERLWIDFVLRGADAFADGFRAWEGEFELLESETLASALERYEEVARRTDEIVGGIQDLGVGHRLPEAPWFEPGASWSARRVLLHLIAETSQHAGHADIIRESLDGARTMG